MRDCIYFGRFSHCAGLYCQGAKNSGDKQSANWSLLGWQGSTKTRLAHLQGAPVRSASSTYTLFREPLSKRLLAVFLLPHTWPGFPSQMINSSDLSRQPVLNQPVLDGLLL